MTQIENSIKEYYVFKVIEIESFNKVKEHKTFIFRCFSTGTENGRLLLNEDHSKLLEILDNNRIYLYQWQEGAQNN